MTRQTKCACRDCVHAIKEQDSDGRELCAGCEKVECDGDGREACQRADFVAPNTGGSGYTNCACRDCFDIAMSDDVNKPDLCWECDRAGCDAEGHSECERLPEDEEEEATV